MTIDNEMVQFTVVIPLHNKERHIDRAITSVLAQTLAPAQIIVIDDASSDAGLERAASYDAVTIIRRDTPGPGGYAARNAGIAAASTPWIAFLDADDEWASDHLETCASLIAASGGDAVMVGSGYEERHPGGATIQDVYSRHHAGTPPRTLSFTEFVELWLRIGECPVWTSSLAARRDVLLDTGGFPADRCRRGGDKDMWLRLAKAGAVVVGSHRTAIYHKDSDNMVTGARFVNQCHCVSPTIGSWLDRVDAVSPREAALLRRLRNRETFAYALRTAKTDRVRFDSWRGFSARQDPTRFLVLAMLTTPLGFLLGQAAQRLLRRTA